MRNLFTQLLQQSYSNQTNDTLSRDYRMGVMSGLVAGHMLCATSNRGTTRFLRLAAMVTLLLTLACGQMWAWNTTYLMGDPTGSWSKNTDYSMGNSDANSRFFYLTKNNYFAFYIDYYNYQIGPSSNGNTITTGDGGQKFSATNTSNSAKYTGNTGIVEVHVQQKDNGDNTPWVWLTRPTVYIRHKWNDSSASTVAMTDNNDGTYKYTGYYSSSSPNIWVGPENATSASNIFKYFTSSYYTKVGSPINGDKCIFEYNASGYNSNKNSTTNRGTLTVTKLYSFTYDGNGKTSGTVPTGVTDAKWNVNFTTATQGTLVRTGYVFVGWNTASDGTGRYYAPGTTYAPTEGSMTLYAMWLQVHSPAGIGNTYYGEALTQVSDDYYEVYRYAVSSGTVYVNAGTSAAPTTSGTRVVYSFTGGNSSKDSIYSCTTWMAHSKTYSVGTGSATASGEFPSHSVCQPGLRQGQGYILAVTGYDQFSMYVKDANTSGDKKIHIFINNEDVSPNTYNTTFAVRRYDLDPDEVSIIRVVGHTDNNNQEQGFSLRLPAAVCGATQPGTITKGTLSACTLRLTAGGSAASNNTWYWQSASDGTDKTESGATKDVTSPGTYYIRSYYSTDKCWSDAQSVTVSASDLTPAAPTALAASSATAKGVTLTVTDAANTNDYEFYVSTDDDDPESGTTATHSVTSAKSLTITNLYAGTTFYAWARAKCGSYKSAWTALTDDSFETSTVSVTHTLTNVTKTSGATSGVGGSAYTAVYSANTDYSMPTPTVTIDGNTATSGTDYTWSSGTLTIPANKINGNIVITLNSAATAPSSVSIGGSYHYYPGETISLTATATGGNGPKTYQWYKGGTAEGNKIAGATSATYEKATCVVGDAGSYYCKVTCGGSASKTSSAYQVKIMQFYLKNSSGSDISNHALTKVDATHATLGLSLTGGTTYKFCVTDGCGNWFGNYDETGMTSSNCTNWTMPHDADCKMTTNGKSATYIFNFDFSSGLLGSQMKVSIVYPEGDQAASKVIYWDNSVLNWSAGNQWYRIGKGTHNTKTQMTLVSGTANLYKVTTAKYDGFEYWHIANNEGQGTGNIYWTKDNAGTGKEITHAMGFEGYPVTASAVTVTPTTTHSTGSSSDNNNCEFYTYSIAEGMKTDNVKISAAAHGTITVNYTSHTGTASSFTNAPSVDMSQDLAHTVILTSITAVPDDGYAASAITINGGAYSANYVVTGATTIAASFSPATYTVTLNTNSGTINSGDVDEYTYLTGATLPTDVTRSGYRFMGWYADDEFSGDRVYSIGTSEFGNKEYWAKWAQLYAITDGEPSNGSLSITDGSSAITEAIAGETVYIVATPSTGYTFDAWNIYKTGTPATTVSPAAATASTSFTMPAYAVTVNASFVEQTYALTYDNGDDATGSASGGTAAGSYTEGTTITVPAQGTLANEGYTFRGWTDGTTFYLAGQTFSMPASDVELTAVWDDGGSACYEWAGTPSSWTDGSITADSKLVIESDPSDASKTAINASSNNQVWNEHTETVIAISGTGNYIQGYFNDASEISTLTISAANNNSTSGTDKQYLVLFCANSSFSSGVTGQLHAAPSYKDNRNDTKLVHEFTAPAGTKYFRVYRKISSDVGDYSTSSGAGDGQTTRIYRIEVCTGGSASYDVSFANMTGFGGSTTLPSTIEGVPSGKKLVQPADPSASGYEFGGWYSDAACTAGNEINWSTMTITADKTIYAKWCANHTVTWMVNGSEYTTGSPTTSANECDGITTLPTAPADNTLSCADSFRGWSTTNLYGESGQAAPASLFVTAADAPSITKDTVFYAIFGDAASASATSFTSTFTSKAWADSGSKWRSIQDGGQLTSGRGIQVTTTNNDAKAITKAEYKAVTKVVVTYSTNSSSGAGSIEIKVGGTVVSGSADVTTDGGETDRTINYIPATSLDGKVQIYVNCTTNSIYIKSVQIYHSGTFENYRCICPTMTVTPKLVTASTPIFITSAASKTVRSQDSLVIVGSGLSKSTAITLSSPASKFELRSRTNGVISTDATGAIDTVAYIYYTPGVDDTDDGLDKNANFTVSVAGNGAKDVTVSQALIGRHVPTNFVIAAQVSGKWYALPADKANNTQDTIRINVRNDSVLIPEDHVYSLYGQTSTVINGGDGQTTRLAMHGISPTGKTGYAPLFGSDGKGTKLGQSGNSTLDGDIGKDYWWVLTQTNTSVSTTSDVIYNMTVANGNTKHVRISGNKWGLYASGVDEIRLFNWIPNHKVFFADGNLTPASHTSWPETVDSVLVGAKISAPTTPTASGYTFVGWYREAECTNAWNFASDVVTEDITLYAKWTGSDYNITYHLDGASWVSTGAATYTSGVGYTLPVAGDMTNIGYTFNGWYANSDLSTGGVVTAIGISETGDKEFWAKWTENTYTVTYDKNGGSGSDMSSTVGHYVTLSNNAYTAPSGKIFVEWNTASDGSGTGYGEGEDVELKADLDLYAIWANDYTITWGNVQIGGAGATVTPNLGGGNYTITASVSLWTGTLTTSMISALTDGVTITNVAVDNSSSPKTITATFNVGASVAGESISFELDVPAAGVYGAKSSTKDIAIDRCTGSEAIIYSMRMTAYNACEVNSTYGGSCALGSYDSGNTVTANGHTHYKPSGTLFTVTLKSGVTFQAGDSLVLYMTASKDTKTTGYNICKSAGSSTLVLAVTKEMTSGTEYHVTSKLTAAMTTIVGASSIRLDRYNGDTRFYGIDIIRPAGGGSGSSKITPTLTWDTDLSGGVAAETGDADFTHTVTQNKNSLGAITYSSSNTSVVTVNATTGKVHIVGAGDATITATIAASGCYEKATATYNIHAEDNCEDIAGTIGTEDLGCLGIKMTVTGYTSTGSETFQWYKDGAAIGDATNDNYTATSAGEYYVEVTNPGDGHCAMASANTITVEAQTAATATKLVDEWYVKNGRRTPDIALVQTENADNFQVKSGSTVIWDTKESVVTGFAGCSFYLGEDGIIYLKGQKDDETVPGGLSAGDETLKFTAKACGGDADDVEITIHKQAATDRPSVAFVVDGTKEGDFDAENEDHSVGTALYDYLDYTRNGSGALDLFDLTPQNVYSTVDEKAIRQHYSQFDAIIITDDPSTSTKIGKKSCVDAFGTMIDIRPILTMEAYVSSLSNWKAKGISGNPTSPNPRQYAMKLECKDHAIFNGLNPASDNVHVDTEGGVDYWTVTMVDKTKSPYAGLDDDKETGGGEKPALQGFSASNVDGLLLLGEISEGTLYTGVERQDEPAARLMLLGVQYKALPSALTPEGLIVIKNALKYLLKTDMEEVDDCSNYFTDAYGDHKWSTAANWSKGKAPDVTVKARILKPCVIDGTAYAAQVDIATSGKSSKFDTPADCSGKLTIDPTGALIVGGEVRSAKAPYFNTGDLKPTEATDLVLNTNGSNQSALILDNDEGDTKATVNLYSLGRKYDAKYQYQYFAIPMEYLPVNPTFANENHGGTKIYTYVWEEGTSSWTRRKYYDDLFAFEGLGITTNSSETHMDYTMTGNLTSTAERDITLTADGAGNNIIGNSYTAPINIASLRTALVDDANIVDKTIYIYCAGNDSTDGDDGVDWASTEEAGQWLAIPIDASGWSGWDRLKVIPAMQAFCIKANTGTTLTLNYKDHVRSTATTQLNQPLRAPKREAEAEGIDLMRIRVADSKTHTDLYLFEGEQFSEAFDNGWEAKYMSGDGRSAKLYAESTIGQLAVAAQPEYEGTVLGFAPGQETEYIFTFSGPDKEYYLNDLRLKKSTLISEGESYLFTFEEGDTNRFYISKTRIDAPAVATGTENTADGAKARKVIVNDKLYIIRNGRVYSAEGIIVK